MNSREAGLLAIMVLISGCTTTTQQTRYVSSGEFPIMVIPRPGQSSVDTTVAFEDGLVRGQLTWTDHCRMGFEERSYDEVIEVKKADGGKAVGAIVLGAITGLVSGLVLANRNSLSDEQVCRVVDGDSRCSSPRTDATLLGATGAVTSVVLVGAGVGTLGVEEEASVVNTVDRDPIVSRVTDKKVPCGNGPIQGVGVALRRGTDSLAMSTTNSEGRFALVVPARTTGPISVIVQTVPENMQMLKADTKLAEVDIPAVAEESTD
jgi:hypothetical protein